MSQRYTIGLQNGNYIFWMPGPDFSRRGGRFDKGLTGIKEKKTRMSGKIEVVCVSSDIW